MPNKKAFVIEDTDHNRMLIRTILEIEQFDIIESEDGTGVIETAEREMPNIILMDIQLPNINGIDLIQILKGNPKTSAIPIIAITAFAMPRDRDRILASGCEEYLSKPFNTSDLIGLLKKYTS